MIYGLSNSFVSFLKCNLTVAFDLLTNLRRLFIGIHEVNVVEKSGD